VWRAQTGASGRPHSPSTACPVARHALRLCTCPGRAWSDAWWRQLPRSVRLSSVNEDLDVSAHGPGALFGSPADESDEARGPDSSPASSPSSSPTPGCRTMQRRTGSARQPSAARCRWRCSCTTSRASVCGRRSGWRGATSLTAAVCAETPDFDEKALQPGAVADAVSPRCPCLPCAEWVG
jgi:hypothetical protein